MTQYLIEWHGLTSGNALKYFTRADAASSSQALIKGWEQLSEEEKLEILKRVGRVYLETPIR